MIASSGGGIRTPDTRIMIPPATINYPDEFANRAASAAPGTAIGVENAVSSADADLAEVIDHWATLPEAIRRAVLALVRSTI